MKYQRNYLSYAIWTPQIRSVVKNRHPSIVCPFDYLTSTHNATGVTLFSTHHHSHDIKLLDYAISLITHGEQYPVFLMRDTLRLHPHLPAPITTLITRHILKGSIPMDQSNPRAIFEVSDEIHQVYKQNKPFVVFPGSTRDAQYINEMVPKVVQLYHSMLEKKIGLDNQVFSPVAVTYDDIGDATISFGNIRSFDEFSRKELGDYVFTELIKLTGANRNTLLSAADIAQKIKTR